VATTSLLPRINLNAFFAALFSGAVAGVLIGGVIARLSMRVVALLLGTPGDFSLGGTLGILMIGGVFGVIFGALYPLLRPFFRLSHLWPGAAYGALWSLVVAFFFLNPEGELALISPWIGAALFVPIPILQGVGTAWLYARVERRMVGAPERSLPLGWFVGLLVAIFLAAVGMSSLAGEGVRLPRAIFDWTSQLGIGFARTGDFHSFLGVLFIVAWLGLCLLLFGIGGHSRRGRLTALGLLLMAGGLFHVQLPFAGTMAGIPVGRWASAALTGAGAASLMVLLLSLPRRSLRRIEIGLTSGVFVAVLLWTGSSQYRLPREMPIPESVLWGAALVVVGGATILALARSWNERPARLPALCWALAVASFLGIWAATLLNPALNIQGVVHPFAPLGVTVYLLPWLLPLAATVVAARSGLWERG
jgi:hypothetical protein